MYLTYDEYAEAGGSAFDEDGYEAAEWMAETILDDVTLNRLQTVDWSEWSARVKCCMLLIIETIPALEEAFEADTAAGADLTGFNNGVDSFSFSASSEETEGEAVQAALVRRVTALLPVELCSACAGYNHAR